MEKKKRVQFEDLPIPGVSLTTMDRLARSLADGLDKKTFSGKYAPVKAILKLAGAGVFLAASVAVPHLPRAVKPFLDNRDEYESWKRFNIPYLKRTLSRLENQKLVEIKEDKNQQIVEITDRGRKRLFRYSLDELSIKKPRHWDGTWRLISYDIPKSKEGSRTIFREYLRVWDFYPLHESTFFHAFPCEKEVEFLREYLGIGKYVRIFTVSKIENDAPFREFFGV